MYSLYRAWLSLGPSCPLPPLPSPPAPLNLSAGGAPDVHLQVGPNLTQFSAHRAVLAAHSGFFKAALLNQDQNGVIVVPNVNVDEFSSLLTFMYTGFLDLNLCNIYNILLSTHILHMPRALELCRGFLLQNHAPPPPPLPVIIKPIPSRKPLQISNFPPPIPPTTTINHNKVTLLAESSPFKIFTPTPSTSKQEEPAAPVQCSTKKSNQKRKVTQSSSSTIPQNVSSSSTSNEKVIIDIACCDGPVRFHRVINTNYGKQNGDMTSPHCEPINETNKISQNAALNKVMNENIRDQNQQQQKNSFDENHANSSPSSSSTNEHFTCLYCNHTFKSQYCYQKHARRHLNPLALNKNQVAPSSRQEEVAIAVATPSSQHHHHKREVKLLDMNVQYYPCKTCGSKFPSYYFVHKHRKMCHADELSAEKNQDGGGEEALEKEGSNASSGAGSATIDVEGINTDD